jgi:hypothetical protein
LASVGVADQVSSVRVSVSPLHLFPLASADLLFLNSPCVNSVLDPSPVEFARRLAGIVSHRYCVRLLRCFSRPRSNLRLLSRPPLITPISPTLVLILFNHPRRSSPRLQVAVHRPSLAFHIIISRHLRSPLARPSHCEPFVFKPSQDFKAADPQTSRSQAFKDAGLQVRA